MCCWAAALCVFLCVVFVCALFSYVCCFQVWFVLCVRLNCFSLLCALPCAVKHEFLLVWLCIVVCRCSFACCRFVVLCVVVLIAMCVVVYVLCVVVVWFVCLLCFMTYMCCCWFIVFRFGCLLGLYFLNRHVAL